MRLILATAAASMALAFPTVALAAPAGASSTITGTASAEVIAPLQISCGAMHWGQLAPQHTAKPITMNAQGNPLTDPYDLSVPGDRDNAQPGNCTVTGVTGMTFNVTLPTTSTLTKVGGGPTMTMDSFTISADFDATPSNWLLRTLEDESGVGTNRFGIGATLTVGGDQPSGLYQGTYTVSVQYN